MAVQLLSTTVLDEFRCRILVFMETCWARTWFLLKVLNLEESWLYLSPELWPTSNSYQTGKKFVTNVKVVNNTAERALKSNVDYAAILTDIEEQCQNLLQIVEKHHQDFLNFKKSTPALQSPH